MSCVTSLPAPTSGVEFSASDVEILVDSASHGRATSVVVAQSRISFVFDDSAVISLDYQGICLHAISTTASEKRSLLVLLKGDLKSEFNKLRGISQLSMNSREEAEGQEEEEEGGEDEEEGEEAEEKVTEVRLCPADPAQLDAFYESVTSCLQLHRDDEEQLDDEDEDEEEGEDPEEGIEDDDFEGEDAMETVAGEGGDHLGDHLGDHVVNYVGDDGFPADEEMTSFGWRTLRRLETLLAANYAPQPAGV